MTHAEVLDRRFDLRSDANGKDPDFASLTLRRYHRALWSKPLPGGADFTLDASIRGHYLYHRSKIGEFSLSSDGVIATFTGWPTMAPIVGQLPDAMSAEFLRASYTIGGFMLWPGNRIGGKWTINQARGCTRRISDRMDLTLECIRRHYLGVPSPLAAVLDRYEHFLALFEDFRGYVDFWLLQDLVTEDYATVNLWLPFDNFNAPHVPVNVDSYLEYRRQSIDFVERRGQRMLQSGPTVE